MLDQPTTAGIARFARDVLVAHLIGHAPPSIDNCPQIPHHGLFVTLRTNGQLRGCIGTFRSDEPLGPALARIVIESAQDSRFLGTPLCARDLSTLMIEISMLSDLTPIKSPAEIQIGLHGILVECDFRRGCFLPDVATQYNWDGETFVRQCCTQKMGMNLEVDRDDEVRLHVFTVEKIVA